MSHYKEAQQQYDFVSSIAENVFNRLAKENKIMLKKVATVASVNTTTNTATVYFPGDNVNESSSYKNITGQTLSVGDKVYIIYEFGDIQQGWIFTK